MRMCRTCGAVWDDAYDFCSFDGGSLDVTFKGPRVIGDRYLLEQRVAAGAMGVVFRATHLQLGSTVAVKLMQPLEEALVVGLLRFHREAQILGQIKHPNAVLVIDFGVEERADESLPYLVTEFLRGEGLDAVLSRRDALGLEEAAHILIPMCDAVQEAHEIGVIHRDIKPSNVFLEKLRDGTTIVKVLDFGIAKFVEVEPALLAQKRAENAEWALRLAELHRGDDDAFLDEVATVRADEEPAVTQRARPRDDGIGGDAPTLEREAESSASGGALRPPTVTEAGFMVGTIPYMAPEQMTGDAVSRQTDVYAIATLAFQLLTGTLPFEGDDDTIISQKLSAPAPSAIDRGAQIPPELDAALQQALALDPADRGGGVLPLATAFADAARALSSGEDEDAGLSLSIQTGALTKIIGDVTAAVDAMAATAALPTTSDHYANARDRLLALPGPLSRTQRQSAAFEGPLDLDTKEQIESAAIDLDQSSHRLTKAVTQLPPSDASEFLRALWVRAMPQVDQTLRSLDRIAPRTKSPVGPEPVVLPPANPFAPAADDTESALLPLLEIVRDGDDLDAADAADRLLSAFAAPLREHLRRHGDDDLALAGLWRHSDRLLLKELYDSTPPRVLPLLAGLSAPSAAGFVTLATLFGDIEATSQSAQERRAEFLATSFGASRDDNAILFDRCLTLHPSDAVRDDAIDRLPLAAAWPLLLSGPLPLAIPRRFFVRATNEAGDEYLKVFFLCVKDLLSAASDAELPEAFLLMRACFNVDCFHEDVVFEPLLEVDQWLQSRAEAAGMTVTAGDQTPSYAAVSAAFTAQGMRETRMNSMRAIPLAVQRKLAREGHFVERFMSHPLDKVALETLPHLVRREDVARFLRIPTIHRSVITELAKVRRLFRKDQARLALLQNPKTPANVARVYLPLLPHAQVQNLSRNKHIGAEVRSLAQTFADKIARRTE